MWKKYKGYIISFFSGISVVLTALLFRRITRKDNDTIVEEFTSDSEQLERELQKHHNQIQQHSSYQSKLEDTSSSIGEIIEEQNRIAESLHGKEQFSDETNSSIKQNVEKSESELSELGGLINEYGEGLSELENFISKDD